MRLGPSSDEVGEIVKTITERAEARARRPDLKDPAVLEELLAGVLEGDDKAELRPSSMRRSLENRLGRLRAAEARRAEIDAMTTAEVVAAVPRGF